MNCAEYRDNFVAWAEGLLDRDLSLQCQAHLETCAACRAEYAAVTRLQQRLAARGRAAAEVRIVEPVMRRIRREQFEPKRETIMSRLLKHRWGFGLGAAASATAMILLILLAFPKTQATAAEVMAKGAQAVAKLTGIHLRGQMRTYPAGNFSAIDPDVGFCTIELWKQFEPELKWRVEKPGRVAVMDGRSKLMFNKADKEAFQPSPGNTWDFDTEWLQRMANLSTTISNELDNARSQGWKLDLTEKPGADGRMKSIVTVHAEFGLPEDDPLKNVFFDIADTRRVYCFDARTKLLEGVQIYLRRPSGEVLIFDLSQIEYNPPVNPDRWRLDLPADVAWIHEPQILPDNEKYASLTAEQAARAFLEACGRKDWDETDKFMPMTPDLKQYLGGLEIISLGESFTSRVYAGRFVPYVVKLAPEEINIRVSSSNAAKRYVVTGMYNSKLQPQRDDDFKWTNAPAILPDNDTYARMSPVEVVTACARAYTNLDWVELKKFCPDNYVENNLIRQFNEAEKAGLDVHQLVPKVEVVEAFWSAEQSSWFVKCRLTQIKKSSLVVRKDNPAGRWQVDGGI